ncbi:aldo/keto reductase [Lactobacillus paragasseri]|uniref:aldo/keto reductase n=1 Tax=Lactobacillus paragasseri TaxID=2107999 RepID=UPI0012E2B5F0|nr:aldo/keto reductase [Lactobacillus paragasseri]MDK8087110.1 aldo/keto reductase [Lactobacillus paragasseri]MDX5118948.1 aldo/keto reductase [Lactobacillus paragasseri]MDX5122923.1 aldo/keto reductase [Lactobacillus paragasseri]QGT98265.1 aldo/keto reductase [Lactobacillus paragasseri]UWI47686.1 aldo/keto reductase [Lactobacillus paragasseri]
MNFNSLEDTYTLNNGVKIPIIGFGTWQTPDGDIAKHAVEVALNAGYRHIDTAAAYGNEKSVGQAIKNSGINRHDLFITTKLWNADHGYKSAKAAIDRSLQNLKVDYLDLYLIHWPNPVDMRDHWAEANAESWRAMEEAVQAGKIRAIGVSNFRKRHLDELLKTAEIKPVVNQIMLNPSDLQPDVVKVNNELKLLSEAYSPLGTGGLLGNETVNEIASEVGKSPAQVLIRWSLEHGFLPLPKSVHDKYIRANAEVFDFNLSSEQMNKLDSLHGVSGLATDPDTASF